MLTGDPPGFLNQSFTTVARAGDTASDSNHPSTATEMSWPHRLFAHQFTDFELKLLRVFRVVVDCGGFSAAEPELGLTMSSISKHISDLEIRLGVRLCERGRGGFALTDAGKVVYDCTTQLLVALEEFRSRINAFHSDLVGEFYIGFIDTLVTGDDTPLQRILSTYAKAHPSLKFNMILGSASEIDRALEERRLHIGVSVSGNENPTIKSIPISAETGYLYCGRDHPLFGVDDAELTYDRLVNHGLVQHGYSAAESQLVAQLGLKTNAISHQTEGVLFLVLAGQHLGFLPKHYADRWEATRKIRPILPRKIQKQTTIALKAHVGSLNNPMVGSFLDITSDVILN
jgi:DNA-binding transcriptional LysR family regulator